MAVPTVVPDDTRRAFGEWLKQRRKELGFSQEEASRRARLTRQQWIRYENGESGTRRETIPQIALAMGVSTEETFRRAGYSHVSSSDADEVFAQDIERIVRRVPAHIRPQIKNALRRQAEQLAELTAA